MMDIMNFALGGAAFGVIASCWSYIKGIAWKLISILIQKIEIYDATLQSNVTNYLINNYKRSSVYDRVYTLLWMYLEKEKQKKWVGFEHIGSKLMLFWSGWMPFIVTLREATKGKDGAPDTSGYMSILFVRKTLNIDQLMSNTIESMNKWEEEKAIINKKHLIRFEIKYIPPLEDKNTLAKEGHGVGHIPIVRSASYRPLKYNRDELSMLPISEKSALDALVFPPKIKELIDEIKLWRTSRDWYKERNIPWKRGWLLYGPPGTGKTALTRAFAEDMDLPIYIYNLSELSNYGFMKAWIAMKSNIPCIALIEDIDNIFHGRKNITSKFGGLMSLRYLKPSKKEKKGLGKGDPFSSSGNDDEEDMHDLGGGLLTFDCLLNMLDGCDINDGVFTVITTNNIHLVDRALSGASITNAKGEETFISTRPGRIDKAIELTFMEPECKKILAGKILNGYPDALQLVLGEIAQNPKHQETPAQFQEYCAQIALKCFWKDRKQKEDSELAKTMLENPDEALLPINETIQSNPLMANDYFGGDCVPQGSELITHEHERIWHRYHPTSDPTTK